MSSSGLGGNLGDAEAAAIIAGEELLSRDNIPNENQQIDCFSCGETMTGLYCHSCGQKNDDYRRSIWSLFSETFASVFSLENRMWRTWLMLLRKPGHVAREFSDGKRTSWTSPVRIYLAMSIILFGYMSVTQTRIFSVWTDIVPRAGFTGEVEKLADPSVKLEPDFGFFRRQAQLDRLNSGTDFDRVTRLMHGTPREVFFFNNDLTLVGGNPSDELLKSSQSWPDDADEDTIDDQRSEALESYTDRVDDLVDQYNDILQFENDPETIATRIVQAERSGALFGIIDQFREGSTEELRQSKRKELMLIDQSLKKLGLTRSNIHALPVESKTNFNFDIGYGTVNGRSLSQTEIQDLFVQILRNPALLNNGISRYLPRIMFLIMPFAAVIGLLFIRRKRDALLYDHLVHATYIHAVTFAFLLILILISQWTPAGSVAAVFFIGIAIYLPLSAKSMFRRGWFKTILTSYSVAFLYGFAMFFVVTLLTAQSIIRAIEGVPV